MTLGHAAPHLGHAAPPQGLWSKESHVSQPAALLPASSTRGSQIIFARQGCRLSLTLSWLLASGSTHLAEGDRPGTGPRPKRAPRCRSSPPAWLALAGGWCTAERGADQAAVGCRGNVPSWYSSSRASTGNNCLGSEAGTALLAQFPSGTQRDWGCGLR